MIANTESLNNAYVCTKHKHCKDCPEHIEKIEMGREEGCSWWLEVDPLVYCKRAIIDSKPRFVGDARGLLKPPAWCPLRTKENESP